METDDEDIIKEHLEGNQDSFRLLVEKYTPSIYNFSVRFVGKDNAPDIVQEVFIKAWKSIKKFDIKKASFKTWIFTITRNTVTDYLRKKKNIPFSSLEADGESFPENIVDETILPDEALAKLQDNELLNNALDKLSKDYKEVLVLYYQEEMTFNDIGFLIGKPMNTVKSYHYRALKILHQKLL